MTQARGANAKLRGTFENTWGTNPGSAFFELPFKSINLGAGQTLESDPILGQGRDPTAPYLGDEDLSGQIVVPLDVRGIGTWLKATFGAPTTAGAGPYTHTFDSGASALPSLSLETAMPDLGKYFMSKGCRVGSIQVPFLTGSGFPDVTLQVTGQDETYAGTTGAGTPTARTLTRFLRFHGSLTKDTVALANVVAANLTYSNNLDAVRYVGGSTKLGDLDPDQAALTGQITVRLKDTVLLDAAAAGTAVALVFTYQIDSDHSLVWTVYEAYLSRPKKSIQGPGGVQLQFDWQAAKNTSAGRMCEVVLTNDVASY